MRTKHVHGTADPSWICFSTELSWACPSNVMKNAFCPRPLSYGSATLPLSSRPEHSAAERSLCWRPFLDMFFDRAKRRNLRFLFRVLTQPRTGFSRISLRRGLLSRQSRHGRGNIVSSLLMEGAHLRKLRLRRLVFLLSLRIRVQANSVRLVRQGQAAQRVAGL